MNRRIRGATLHGLFALGACDPSIDAPKPADASTDASAATTGSPATTGSGPTDPSPTTGADDLNPDSSTSDASSTDDATVGSVTTTTSGSDGGEQESSSGGTCVGELPNGAVCRVDCECESGACYVVPGLGGFCGACNDDDDCGGGGGGGGCSMPRYADDPVGPSVCNSGGNGDGCQSSAACQFPLVCNTITEYEGVFENSTCGGCLSDGDCGRDQLCAPDWDVPALGGFWHCIDRFSVPIGGDCATAGTGGFACGQGVCSSVDVIGIFDVGVCSECDPDFVECREPLFCVNTSISADLEVMTPAFCCAPDIPDDCPR